jgi:protein-S-isoprenylcysteine O-methyltransferase Ste14
MKTSTRESAILSELSIPTLWQRVTAWIVRRRVGITLIVFIALVVEDLIEGVRPHDLTNLRDLNSVVGLGLVLTGLAVRSWAAGILHKQSMLTTQGPYALVRNPLYAGSFLLMLGFCTLIDDVENIWFVMGPFLLIFIFQVREEERRLAARFGARWESYVRSTPRFIPRSLRAIRLGGWSLAQWINNREYRALATTIAGLAALAIWQAVPGAAAPPR